MDPIDGKIFGIDFQLRTGYFPCPALTHSCFIGEFEKGRT
jgi:hypothetical protein